MLEIRVSSSKQEKKVETSENIIKSALECSSLSNTSTGTL